MPIGSGAQRTAAHLHTPSWGTFIEENIWINRPTAPLTNIVFSNDAWTGRSRCNGSGTVATLPLPTGYIIPGAGTNDTPNYSAAIVQPGGNTIAQNQPLTHCTAGGAWTTYDVKSPDQSLYGDGIMGAHGGSGLSSIGGTVRLGELVPGGTIPHAVQWVLSDQDFNCAGGCFRWPATRSDCGTSSSCYPNTGTVGVKPGSLLALPTAYNCPALRTGPGRILCEAMQDYGGYVVDAGWDPHYFAVEKSPDGDVADEFRQRWGFALSAQAVGPWALDVHDIMAAVDLITNNGPSTIGGGGTPRVPLAPPIGN